MKLFKSSLVLLAALFITTTQGSVEFWCAYDMFTINAPIGTFYRCSAQVTIYGESKLLGGVLGQHLYGKTNEDVDHLGVYYQNLPFIPGNIGTFFRNIKALAWQGSNLATISAQDLEQFPKLVSFNAASNHLVSLDGDLFKHTHLIRDINFASNHLKHVGSNLVKSLIGLKEHMNFLYNPCVNTGAYNRNEVLWLNEQLPTLCPPRQVLPGEL